MTMVAPKFAAPTELAKLKARLGTGDAAADSVVAALLEMSGEAARAQWVAQGLLMPGGLLAMSWHRTRQALDQAVERGELFSVRVRKNKFYPAVFQTLSAEDVSRVCKALGDLDNVSKFIFWHRTHGALAGHTPDQALAERDLERVIGLARAFASENARTVHAESA